MSYCPYCGKSVDSGGKFCSGCGKMLDEGGGKAGKESPGPFPRWVLALLLGSVALLGAVLGFTHFAKLKAAPRGNSTGNIVNGGLVASQDGWLYYTNLDRDDGGEPFFELCKVRTDGSGHSRINGDRAGSLNVVDGWIYYHIDGCYDDSGIYKVRTDGGERTRISEDAAAYLSVIGDWIYYVNMNTEPCPSFLHGEIYRVRTDGSERTRISEDAAAYLNVVGDWLYYVKADEEFHFDLGVGEIYKVRIDGSEHTRIGEDAAASLNVVGDWLYYVGGKVDEETYFGFDFDGIYRMRIDGSEPTRICQDYFGFINVVDDWIYYDGGALDDEPGIYKVRTDGGGRTKLNGDGAEFINVVGDWLYYNYINHETNEQGFCKLHTDGSGREAIYSWPYELEIEPEEEVEVGVEVEKKLAGVEILHTLTDQEKRALNIFLSNFSETFFEYYNAFEKRTPSNNQALISFAKMHYCLNLDDQIEGVNKEGKNYFGIRLEKIATKLNRFFYNLNCTPGFIDSISASSDGKYLLSEPAAGASINRFSQVKSLLEEEDGTLEAEIDIYTFKSRPDDGLIHGEVPNWIYDPCSRWSRSNKADAMQVGRATATLVRYEYLGKPSFQLVHYKEGSGGE